MSMAEAMALDVGDSIDFRDLKGRFNFACVTVKNGSNIKIQYYNKANKFVDFLDCAVDYARLAKAGSISKRQAHRFSSLKEGDYVDINPLLWHPGWRGGTIRRLDANSGQVLVA